MGTVIKTMLFTIFCFLCSFCFVVICLTPIAPNVVLRAFDYVGAKTGTNEYISAMVLNGETVKYYGRLKNVSDAGLDSGTLTLDF